MRLLDHMVNMFSYIVADVWSFCPKNTKQASKVAAVDLWANKPENIVQIAKDLSSAVTMAYSLPNARELHARVVAFVLCMEDRMDTKLVEGLVQSVPRFDADLSKTLTTIHFNRAGLINALSGRATIQDFVGDERDH